MTDHSLRVGFITQQAHVGPVVEMICACGEYSRHRTEYAAKVAHRSHVLAEDSLDVVRAEADRGHWSHRTGA